MEEPERRTRADPGEDEAQRLLACLVSETIEPVAKSIIGYNLKVCFRDCHRAEITDAEDIYSETLMQLIARLYEIKTRPDTDGIRNLRSYVAATAYRSFYEHLRRLYPRRYSLKNKLRYLLRHKDCFALWRTEDGDWVAGFARWMNQSPDGASDLRRHLPADSVNFFVRQVPARELYGRRMRTLAQTGNG